MRIPNGREYQEEERACAKARRQSFFQQEASVAREEWGNSKIEDEGRVVVGRLGGMFL